MKTHNWCWYNMFGLYYELPTPMQYNEVQTTHTFIQKIEVSLILSFFLYKTRLDKHRLLDKQWYLFYRATTSQWHCRASWTRKLGSKERMYVPHNYISSNARAQACNVIHILIKDLSMLVDLLSLATGVTTSCNNVV